MKHKEYILSVIALVFLTVCIPVSAQAAKNRPGSTTKHGSFFVAPQVEIYAATQGGKFESGSSYANNIIPSTDWSFDMDVGAGVTSGYDSYMTRNSWGYTFAAEYLFRPSGNNWAYQDITTGQTRQLKMEDTHYFLARALARYRFDKFIPYFGAGTGAALMNVKGTEGAPSGQYLEPVVAGIAGMEYMVTKEISFFAEYKYLTTVQSMDIQTGDGTFKFEPFGSHVVTMGMKYGF